MFKLEEQNAKLTSVNPRAELHGEDHKLACDMNFKITTSNSILDMFSPTLKETFFSEIKDPEQQELDINEDSYLPMLKHREIGKVDWDYKGAGYRVVIAIGVSGENNIVFINAKLGKFKFEMKPGGSVTTSFHVQVNPSPEDVGAICKYIQEEVDLTLEPPKPQDAAQIELDDMAEGLAEEAGDPIEDDTPF